MFSILDVFVKDIENHREVKQKIQEEANGINIPRSYTKNEYRTILDDEIESIKETLLEKIAKIELYVVGISFVVLTGLVTNQLYTSSLFSFKQCSLSLVGFFFGHIFVVASFVLLILFGKEIAKSFMFDEQLMMKKEFLVVPALIIPIFSQINSAMININCSEKATYTQVGFSSVVVGLILVKYVIFDLIELQSKVEQVFNHNQIDDKYFETMAVSSL